MNSLYQYKPGVSPFHVSVGAVVFNDKLEICTHHFFRDNVPEHILFFMDNLQEGYHLMRETIESDETLEQAVYRGIEEEFGATGTIEKYLGSLVCRVVSPTTIYEKTTLYHAVRLDSLGKRTGTDEESVSTLEWYPAKDLLELYRHQATLTNRPELNETVIIERFMKAYEIE